MLSAVILVAAMHNFAIMRALMVYITIISVVMLSVVRPTVVMLNVAAPFLCRSIKFFYCEKKNKFVNRN